MTASQIIHEIEALPPEEQAKVVRFAYRLDAERRLTGAELSALAESMVASVESEHQPARDERTVR